MSHTHISYLDFQRKRMLCHRPIILIYLLFHFGHMFCTSQIYQYSLGKIKSVEVFLKLLSLMHQDACLLLL